MAKIWGPSVFGPRKPGSAESPESSKSPASPAPGAGGAASDRSGTSPGRRPGPLPSLSELGAFDGPAGAAAKPRLSGRLSDEDLRGMPPRPAPGVASAKPHAVPTPGAAAAGTPSSAGAAPPPVDEPMVQDGLPSAPSVPASGAKTVPGVTVGWSDLNAAVEAGWVRPEAAHALWARWLAHKPITRVEDDGTPLPPLPPLPLAVPPPAASAGFAMSPPVGPGDGASSLAAPLSDAPLPAEAPRAVEPAPAGRAPSPAETAPVTQQAEEPPAVDDDPMNWDDVDFEQAAGPRVGRESSRAHATGPTREHERERPEVMEAEILEPLQDADARRAAERAAQPPPTIEVVDVIEVPSLAPQPKAPGRAWVVGQFALALVGAVAAALSVGLGHTLFGPWGAAAAALGWTVVVWRATSRWHASGQTLRALLGAHAVLPLMALGIWQVQVALGWWPSARPMDLFTDPPLRGAAQALPGLQLDGRWLTLAALPLAAALLWLVRLRHPLMLASVTGLLWMVAFQAVAGVLQALGLSFHGMSTFMVLLGALTLGAGLYIDLQSRAVDLPDYARWPYWFGAVLLTAGWLSMAALPMPVPVLRWAGWVVFVAWAVSIARPSLLAVALGGAGFELAWALRQAFGSDLLGLGVWALWLGVTVAIVVALLPFLPALARPLRFWMPGAWRPRFRPRS